MKIESSVAVRPRGRLAKAALAVGVCASALLAACGQKGPLMPAAAAPSATASAPTLAR